jgi:pimeloyl-ACP methyl ester carboxylesterase
MYQVKRQPRSEYPSIRNLRYHALVWGQPQEGQAPWVLVHGWMDVAASYQFVVDALAQNHYLIAPDWRGYGQSQPGPEGTPQADSFWFADYLADLDFVLDHYAPNQPVNLVGHSMGGNVAMLYAGVRPERIRRLINLEGFGMPATVPAMAPGRYAKWMDELKKFHANAVSLQSYDSADSVARRLMKTNPRLASDKAAWLARQWARESSSGTWEIQGHAAHKLSTPLLYRVEEVLAIYQRITAPVLAVEASDSGPDQWWKGAYTLAQYHERLQSVPNAQIARIQNAGHMLHHDQPEALAALMEGFLE